MNEWPEDFIPCHLCGMKNDAERCKEYLSMKDYEKTESHGNEGCGKKEKQ